MSICAFIIRVSLYVSHRINELMFYSMVIIDLLGKVSWHCSDQDFSISTMLRKPLAKTIIMEVPCTVSRVLTLPRKEHSFTPSVLFLE